MRFKFAHMFRDPRPEEIRLHQMNEAEVNLLEAQAKLEYYRATVTMWQKRITRLKENQAPTLVDSEILPPYQIMSFK